MKTDLSPEQALFQETTAKFLNDKLPTSAVRALRHSAEGFDRTYWRQGAELGWTSLLVNEDAGGGSIDGRGVIDLTLVGYDGGIGVTYELDLHLYLRRVAQNRMLYGDPAEHRERITSILEATEAA